MSSIHLSFKHKIRSPFLSFFFFFSGRTATEGVVRAKRICDCSGDREVAAHHPSAPAGTRPNRLGAVRMLGSGVCISATFNSDIRALSLQILMKGYMNLWKV